MVAWYKKNLTESTIPSEKILGIPRNKAFKYTQTGVVALTILLTIGCVIAAAYGIYKGSFISSMGGSQWTSFDTLAAGGAMGLVSTLAFGGLAWLVLELNKPKRTYHAI